MERELSSGISTEVQVVYLMTGVRKLLEQEKAKREYENLTFHCDWALHSRLSGPAAQKIVRQFGDAGIHLMTGVKFRDLPAELKRETDRILQMKSFKEELYDFLQANQLPTLEASRPDGSTYFLHLYAQVVQDCPLELTDESATIGNVTIHLQLAREPSGEDMLFRVTWTLTAKSGASGDIDVISSFSTN